MVIAPVDFVAKPSPRQIVRDVLEAARSTGTPPTSATLLTSQRPQAALVDGKGQCCQTEEQSPISFADAMAWDAKPLPEMSRQRLRRRRMIAAKVLRGRSPRVAGGCGPVQAKDQRRGRWYPVTACGTVPHSGGISLEVRASGRVDASGIMRCGSAWTCCECSQRIATHRAIEIKTTIDAARSKGCRVEMVTFTLPHDLSLSAGEAMRRLKDALKGFSCDGTASRALRARGFLGQVRAIEVTYGHVSGWHFHAHAVVVFERDDFGFGCFPPRIVPLEHAEYHSAELFPNDQTFDGSEADAEVDFARSLDLKKALYPVWKRAAHAAGAETPSFRHGFDVRVIWTGNDYISKLPEAAKAKSEAGKSRWGAEAELSKAYMKEGRKSSRTPWELLDGAETSEGDAQLFRDYARATWGRSQIEWSKGARNLRKLFLNGAEDVSDEALVHEDPEWVFDDEAGENDSEPGQENLVIEHIQIASADAWRARRENFGSLDRCILAVERGDALSLASALRDEGWTLVQTKGGGWDTAIRPDRAGRVRECFSFEPTAWCATWPGRHATLPS